MSKSVIKDKQVPSNLGSCIELFKIARNVTAFQKWFQTTYNKKPNQSILHGYKYLVEGCLHIFFDAITDDNFAGLKNDFTLYRAAWEWISLEELSDSCNKIVFLKNVYLSLRPILKAKDFSQLEKAMADFQEKVLAPFERLLQKKLRFKHHPKLKKAEAVQLSRIWTLYIYFIQIANRSPVAHVSFLAGTVRNTEKKYETAFEGYKYGLQYLWLCVLGDKKFKKSSLAHLNKADSWKKYIYNKDERPEDEIEHIFKQTYDLEKQTCLDSYFERVKREILRPLEKKYKVNFMALDKLWILNSNSKDRKYFEGLLTKSWKDPFAKLSNEKKIQTTLYWHPIIVMDSERSSSYGGVAAFNTMLAGTVALKRKERESRKPVVCKFKHPVEEGRNMYTYGILVDTKSATENYQHGWILYYNCCNDYSGFSSSEHRAAEELINQYI